MRSPTLRVLEREVRVYRRLWRADLFSNFVSPVLYLAAMGLGIGGLVDANAGGVDGLTYRQFVAPGLMAATAMQSAVGASMWPVLSGMKWSGVYKAVVATPVQPADIHRGHVCWVGVRAALTSSAFLVTAVLFGAIGSAWAILAIPATVLLATAFAAPLAAFSATQESDFPFAIVMRLGVLPLFLFSGTFFSIDQLPEALRPISNLSPLYHGVELCRAATTGSLHVALLAHVAVLAACVAGGLAWGQRAFTRRLTP